MPKIPQHRTQASLRAGGLTKEVPLVKVDPAAASLEARAAGEFFGTVAKVTENIYKLQAQNELSQANTKASQGRKTIETQTEDIDPTGWMERRNSDLKNLKQTISKDLKNPLARQQFNLEYDRDAIDTEFRLKKQYTSLTVGQTLNSFYTERDETEKAIYIATSDKEKQFLINKVGTRYSELGRLGAMTPSGAVKEFRKWQDDLIKGQIKNDIVRNPELTKENLIAGNYKGLTAAETESYVEIADKKIKLNKTIKERELEVRQEETESAMGVGILDGTTTEHDVNQAEVRGALGQDGGISKDFATVARRAVSSAAAINAKTRGDTFNRLQDEFVALGIKVKTKKGVKKFSTKANVRDIAKFRANVIEAYNAGEIEPAVGRNWLVAVSNVFDKALNRETKAQFKEDVESEKIDTIQNLWGKLSFWSDEFSDDKAEVKARLGQELMGRLMNTDQDGDEIVDDLILKEQKNKNPNRALYKIDQTINTPLGPAKVIGFDGDGEPIVDNEKIRELSK